MSTPVIIATEHEGVARLFHRNGDGALTQTGQLLVGPVEPVVLATLAADLNEHLNWTKLTKPKAEPRAELPPAVVKPKQTRERVTHRSAEELAAYRDRVVKHVGRHPGITAAEIVEVLHDERTKVNYNLVWAALAWARGKGFVHDVKGDGHNEPSKWYSP